MSNIGTIIHRIAWCLALLIYIGGMILWVAEYIDYRHEVSFYEYSGREYFEAEEYKEFKELLANKNINIAKLNVLASSEDPLIDFRVTKADKGFPYGEERTVTRGMDLVGIIFVGFAGFFLLLLGGGFSWES